MMRSKQQATAFVTVIPPNQGLLGRRLQLIRLRGIDLTMCPTKPAHPGRKRYELSTNQPAPTLVDPHTWSRRVEKITISSSK